MPPASDWWRGKPSVDGSIWRLTRGLRHGKRSGKSIAYRAVSRGYGLDGRMGAELGVSRLSVNSELSGLPRTKASGGRAPSP